MLFRTDFEKAIADSTLYFSHLPAIEDASINLHLKKRGIMGR